MDAGEYLSLLWSDPREVTERPLPDGLDINQLHQVRNPNYGYALRRWLVSEMEGLPGLKVGDETGYGPWR